MIVNHKIYVTVESVGTGNLKLESRFNMDNLFYTGAAFIFRD